jgi:outer membrane protein OmpA-like peptidoglycan-associated protein
MVLKRILIVLLPLALLCACAPQTRTQKGGLYGSAGGAAAGAILGQAIGKDTKGTLIGAAIGAAVGGLAGAGIGNMMDRQEQEFNQALAASDAAAVRREGNLIAITLKGDFVFDVDSAQVKPGMYSELDRIAGVMVQYPQTVIQIEGHTDSTGSESYNMDLSRRRAESVRNLMLQRGVASSRMQVVAYGETLPVASNQTAAGRQMNRRVEIKVAPMQQ